MGTRPAIVLALSLCLSAPLYAGSRLIRAAADGDLYAVRERLAAGENVNEPDGHGWTPLMWAVHGDHLPVTLYLLEHGADPNRQTTSTYRSIPRRATALIIASYWGLDAHVATLVNHGADVSLTDYTNQAPASYARRYGFPDVMVALSTPPLRSKPAGAASAEAGAAGATPDSLLTLKNGAEVRGRLVDMKDGRYTVDLADGRRMSYAVDDVESMRRLDAPSAAVPAAQAPCNVFVTEERVPAAWFTPVKVVRWEKKWYGSTEPGAGILAMEAAALGADGVVRMVLSHGPSAWSWASPKAEGLAVKWTAEGSAGLRTIVGTCFPFPVKQ